MALPALVPHQQRRGGADRVIGALLLAGAAASGYVDASLAFEGDVLGFELVDVDASGDRELVVALRTDDGRRRLLVHARSERGFDARPIHEVDVLEDVIAYGFGDVREEAGRELLFLTRSGAYSYSLTLRGYRDNIQRLVEAPLLFDVPSPRALPHWPYVLPAQGGDRVLLPGRDGFAVYGPRAEEPEDERAARYALETAFDSAAQPDAVADAGPATRDRRDDGDSGGGSGGGELRVVILGASEGPLLPELGDRGSLLSDAKGFPAPALADVDGDGAADILLLTEDGLRVHLARGGAFRGEPDRVESFPDYLSDLATDESLVLRLEDLDGDGLLDLLGVVEKEGDGFEDSDLRLLLLVNDGRRMLPETPHQVLRLEAAVLRVDVIDANADGRPDLSIRKFNLPSIVETVTGLEFTLTHLLFLGEDARGRLVERRPAMRQTQTFDENTVSEVLKYRILERDCDGDGRPDQVEVDLQGRIAIRRLRFDSGFFSGDTWEVEADPWKRFDVRGDVEELVVDDWNDDGLGDLISSGPGGLTILESRRER